MIFAYSLTKWANFFKYFFIYSDNFFNTLYRFYNISHFFVLLKFAFLSMIFYFKYSIFIILLCIFQHFLLFYSIFPFLSSFYIHSKRQIFFCLFHFLLSSYLFGLFMFTVFFIFCTFSLCQKISILPYSLNKYCSLWLIKLWFYYTKYIITIIYYLLVSKTSFCLFVNCTAFFYIF